eukprot:9408836-Lingulodinium_polyedra.AAC.1
MLLRALAALPEAMRARGLRYLQRPAAAWGAALRRAPPESAQHPLALALGRALQQHADGDY